MIQKNKKLLLIVFFVVALVVVVYFVSQKAEVRLGEISTPETQNRGVSTGEIGLSGNGTLTPYERQLEELKTAPLTKADTEEPLYRGSKEKFKAFKIKVTADGYEPNSIIVEKGDSIQLSVFSDKDTDIESADFRLFSPVPAGTVTNLGFLLNQEGTFTFYCKNQCLGAERIFGHIVVRPRL